MNQKERFVALLNNEPVDGYVNQYAPFGQWAGFLLGVPLMWIEPKIKGRITHSAWGHIYEWKEDEPGAIPRTEPGNRVIEDLEEWEKDLHRPSLKTLDSEWDQVREASAAIDTTQIIRSIFMAPGTFEYSHHFLDFQEALMGFLMYPDEMHGVIDTIVDWRIDFMEEIFKHVPDIECVFAHDDWGSRTSTFMSVDTFDEFLLPGYKQLYGEHAKKDHGCMVVHHSDTYGETLLDEMVEMGMDVWEGCLPTNNYEMLQKRITDENLKFVLWGGMDSLVFDRDDSTEEEVRNHVAEQCAKYTAGGHWIPSVNDGLPLILHQEMYDVITDEINKQEAKYFG